MSNNDIALKTFAKIETPEKLPNVISADSVMAEFQRLGVEDLETFNPADVKSMAKRTASLRERLLTRMLQNLGIIEEVEQGIEEYEEGLTKLGAQEP